VHAIVKSMEDGSKGGVYTGDDICRACSTINIPESVVVLICHQKGVFWGPSHQQKGDRYIFGGDVKDMPPSMFVTGALTIDLSAIDRSTAEESIV
jgi:hypothetical protein